MFNKAPRANTKTETLETKINDEAVRLVEAENAEVESIDVNASVDIEEAIPKVEVRPGMFGGLMADDADKIAAFEGSRSDFIAWAVTTFKSWTGKVPEEHIKEFQEACNSHAGKLN